MSGMSLEEIKRYANKKGITLFFRGDEDFPLVIGYFGPSSGDYIMRNEEQDTWDTVKGKLVDWLHRYPDADVEELWV